MKNATPLFGAAYYPEGLSENRIDFDIRQMKETGINTVRLAEFAWSRLEPSEGGFSFSWLHSVVQKLADNDICVILCTPGATPPKWLTDQYPQVLSVRYNGTRSSHGARLHYCPGSQKYRQLLRTINYKLAEEFSRYPSVVGWQIDNEVYPPFGEGCFCPACTKGFQRFLQNRFSTIDNLNEAYQLTLWSQEYASFEAVPAPRPDTPHHPSLKAAWLEYQDLLLQEYIAEQAETIREFSDAPIGTDMMPLPLVDHAAMARFSDVVQFNHYCNEDSLANMFFWMDYIKTLADTPWWNTETDPNFNGGAYATPYRPAGLCRVNSWLPFLFGGEANLYWHWRAHRSGHELMHGSVIDSFGRPTYTHREICRIAEELKKSRDFITETKLTPAKIALHYSAFAEKLFSCQSVCPMTGYQDTLRRHFYAPLIEAGYRVDVIAPDHGLDPYAVILSPFLPCLKDGGLDTRIAEWVKNGGTWIAGPLTDIRNEHASKDEAPLLHLEDWTDTHLCYSAVPNPNFPFRYTLDGQEYSATVWADAFSADSSTVIAAYTNAYEFSSYPLIVERLLGQGRIVLLGTVPTREAYLTLLHRYIPPEQKLCPVTSDNVLCVPREGEGKKGAILIEYRNTPGWIDLPYPAVDLLSGNPLQGHVDLLPYSVMVLQYEKTDAI